MMNLPKYATGVPGRAFGTYAPLGLVWLCLVVLPFGRFVELLILVMAVLGALTLFREWREWWADPRFRLFLLVFLSVWLPVLAALPDAIHPESAFRIAYNHPRFFFSGIFIIAALRTPAQHRRFGSLVGWLLVFWMLDGLVQWAIGVDLLGYEQVESRINALFGTSSLGYGLALALLSPLLLEQARRNWHITAVVLSVGVLVSLVLLSGSRTAWVMLGVIGTAYGIALWRRKGRFPWQALVITTVLAGSGIAALYHSSTQLRNRVDSTAAMLTGETPLTSDSLGHRLWIWRVAGTTFLANPINGVGARSFRHAYREYTPPGDPYLALNPPQAPTHAHHLWLEILTETGLIGALGLAMMHLVLFAAFVRASQEARARMTPFGLCLLAAWFPLNSHMALYSAFWSQLIWWLIAAYCAGADRGLGLARWYLRNSPFRRGKSHLFRWFRSHILADGPARCRLGQNYVINVNLADVIQRHVYMYGVYRSEERHTAFLLSRIQTGDTVLDVGAHVGYYTLLMAESVGDRGHVLAFEPNPNSASQLRTNLALNSLSQVTVIDAAASDQAGEISLHLSPGENTGSTSIHYKENSTQTLQTPQVHIGQMLESEKACPTVIKIDVEGHELAVLRGLTRILHTGAPEVFVEINNRTLRAAGTNDAAVYRFMRECGYSAYRITGPRRTEPVEEPFEDFLVYFKKGAQGI